MSDDTPAPPPTTHADDRELGFGAVDARPGDETEGDGMEDSEAAPGKLPEGGSESAGGAYANGTEKVAGGDHDGQSEQAYSGGDNPNATSTRQASHDRAA